MANWTIGDKISEILIKIQMFSYKTVGLKMFVKWRPFCLKINVLKLYLILSQIYRDTAE